MKSIYFILMTIITRIDDFAASEVYFKHIFERKAGKRSKKYGRASNGVKEIRVIRCQNGHVLVILCFRLAR